MNYEGYGIAEVFKEFLKRLMMGATKPIYVVVDGHSIYKVKIVKKYVDIHNVTSSILLVTLYTITDSFLYANFLQSIVIAPHVPSSI